MANGQRQAVQVLENLHNTLAGARRHCALYVFRTCLRDMAYPNDPPRDDPPAWSPATPPVHAPQPIDLIVVGNGCADRWKSALSFCERIHLLAPVLSTADVARTSKTCDPRLLPFTAAGIRTGFCQHTLGDCDCISALIGEFHHEQEVMARWRLELHAIETELGETQTNEEHLRVFERIREHNANRPAVVRKLVFVFEHSHYEVAAHEFNQLPDKADVFVVSHVFPTPTGQLPRSKPEYNWHVENGFVSFTPLQRFTAGRYYRHIDPTAQLERGLIESAVDDEGFTVLIELDMVRGSFGDEDECLMGVWRGRAIRYVAADANDRFAVVDEQYKLSRVARTQHAVAVLEQAAVERQLDYINVMAAVQSSVPDDAISAGYVEPAKMAKVWAKLAAGVKRMRITTDGMDWVDSSRRLAASVATDTEVPIGLVEALFEKVLVAEIKTWPKYEELLRIWEAGSEEIQSSIGGAHYLAIEDQRARRINRFASRTKRLVGEVTGVHSLMVGCRSLIKAAKTPL
jgi:hypothetical protein